MCREVFPSSFVLFLVSFVFIGILLEFPIFGVLSFLSFLFSIGSETNLSTAEEGIKTPPALNSTAAVRFNAIII